MKLSCNNRIRNYLMTSLLLATMFAVDLFGQGVTSIPRASYDKVLPVAEKGDVQAILILANIYYNGSRKVRPDYRKAEKMFTICAERGIAVAQLYLAQMYYEGNQIPQNDKLAFRWYRAAALQGLPEAQFGLAAVYQEGRGTRKNLLSAVRWYSFAAAQGYGPAQNKLGDLYSSGGEGISTNLVEAYKWYSLAATRGVPEAVTSRDALRSKMTPAEIDSAQREAAAFVAVPHYNADELKRQHEAVVKRAKEIQSGVSSVSKE